MDATANEYYSTCKLPLMDVIDTVCETTRTPPPMDVTATEHDGTYCTTADKH